MSSQGSSSIRTISGAAFTPMSGDPLPREVSTPNASSTESMLEVISRPVDRRAIEPASETASTLGRQSEEEEEEVAVSYGDLQSSLTPEDCTWIAWEYGLEVVAPDDLERPHTPPGGYVTLSELYLKFGVRFSLHPFFFKALKYFGLTVFQITPNEWTHMIGLFCPVCRAQNGSTHSSGVCLVLFC